MEVRSAALRKSPVAIAAAVRIVRFGRSRRQGKIYYTTRLDSNAEAIYRTKPMIQDFVQVDGDTHYNAMKYLTPARMASIGYQFRLLHQEFETGRVLEVGGGAGITSQILRSLGHEVVVVDVDSKLKPDLVASITDLPLKDEEFDIFACYQVLEHLKWELAEQAVRELARIAKLGGVISVPTNQPAIGITLKDSRHMGSRVFKLPKIRSQRIHNVKEHAWELEANVSTAKFVDLLKSAGLTVVSQLQPVQNFYHQFFVVRKTTK